jgi:hypothetical protein
MEPQLVRLSKFLSLVRHNPGKIGLTLDAQDGSRSTRCWWRRSARACGLIRRRSCGLWPRMTSSVSRCRGCARAPPAWSARRSCSPQTADRSCDLEISALGRVDLSGEVCVGPGGSSGSAYTISSGLTVAMSSMRYRYEDAQPWLRIHAHESYSLKVVIAEHAIKAAAAQAAAFETGGPSRTGIGRCDQASR